MFGIPDSYSPLSGRGEESRNCDPDGLKEKPPADFPELRKVPPVVNLQWCGAYSGNISAIGSVHGQEAQEIA